MTWAELKAVIDRDVSPNDEIATIDLDLSEGDNEITFTHESIADVSGGALRVTIDNLGN